MTDTPPMTTQLDWSSSLEVFVAVLRVRRGYRGRARRGRGLRYDRSSAGRAGHAAAGADRASVAYLPRPAPLAERGVELRLQLERGRGRKRRLGERRSRSRGGCTSAHWNVGGEEGARDGSCAAQGVGGDGFKVPGKALEGRHVDGLRESKDGREGDGRVGDGGDGAGVGAGRHG